MLVSEVDDRTLINSLRSTTCPACGGSKQSGKTLCGKQYYKLMQGQRMALYDRIGSGYREAFITAMKALGVTEIKLPPPLDDEDQ